MIFLRLFIAAMPLAFAFSATAANEDGARAAFKYRCMTCHGVSGKSDSARYPNLAGQHAAYIEARLKYFRAAAEPNNFMNGQAAPLTDEDIAALAAYFAEQGR